MECTGLRSIGPVIYTFPLYFHLIFQSTYIPSNGNAFILFWAPRSVSCQLITKQCRKMAMCICLVCTCLSCLELHYKEHTRARHDWQYISVSCFRGRRNGVRERKRTPPRRQQASTSPFSASSRTMTLGSTPSHRATHPRVRLTLPRLHPGDHALLLRGEVSTKHSQGVCGAGAVTATGTWTRGGWPGTERVRIHLISFSSGPNVLFMHLVHAQHVNH